MIKKQQKVMRSLRKFVVAFLLMQLSNSNCERKRDQSWARQSPYLYQFQIFLLEVLTFW